MIYLIALAGLLAAFVGVGAYEHHQGDAAGYTRGHAEYTALKSSYEEAAAKQAAQTASITTKQQEVTTNATTSYETQLAALRTKYAAAVRVRKPAANSGSAGNVSQVPGTSSGPDDTASGGISLGLTCSLGGWAEDALKVTRLQDWVRSEQQANQ